MIVALVLFSAFLHASWNALLKRERDKDRTLIAAVAIAAILAIAVAVVRASLAGTAHFATRASLLSALVAGLFEQIYFVTLARALERGPLGPVYTISRGGAVLVVYPLSILLFGEQLGTVGALGAVAVLCGLVVSDWRFGRASAMPLQATLWASLCALAIASYHLAYKAALDEGGAPSSVFAVSLAFSTALSLLRTGRAGRRTAFGLFRSAPAKLAGMGALCGGSFLILIEALAQGGAGFVLTLRNTSVLFALLLAWVIGERPRIAPAVGAALVAAGAVLMTL
ncbi:MAG TPA: DMT family transporter [Myxococcales bacterium]